MRLSDIRNTDVLVRVNFDLPSLQDLSRMQDAIPTIQRLLAQDNKVILLTHWGRPSGFDKQWSTVLMLESLQRLVNQVRSSEVLVEYVNQFTGFDRSVAQIQESKARVFLLENVRFDSREQSESGDLRRELAGLYASLGTHLVDEAFAVSHRVAASNHDLSRILPSCYGLSYENELFHLNELRYSPRRPFVLVLGGAKLETKVDLLEALLPRVDKALIGGLIGFTFLAAAGVLSVDQVVEKDMITKALRILDRYGDKILLPQDFVYADGLPLDIGQDSLDWFIESLQGARTVFWNGPLGDYKVPGYGRGTLALAEALVSQKRCVKMLGGGDTVAALSPELLSGFDFVSMGGGATLRFLAG